MAASSSPSNETNFNRKIRNSTAKGERPRNAAGSPFTSANQPQQQAGSGGGFHFDILSWYPKHESCVRYFLNHAQHDPLVQAFASFINILLPYQRLPNPIYGSSGATTYQQHQQNRETFSPAPDGSSAIRSVSLLPYIRRLIVTGCDHEQILLGFFGDDWAAGIGPQREQERRNYLFAVKSGGWAAVKRDYDMSSLETVPFLRPIQPTEAELAAGEKVWTEWLAFEEWKVGSRMPG